MSAMFGFDRKRSWMNAAWRQHGHLYMSTVAESNIKTNSFGNTFSTFFNLLNVLAGTICGTRRKGTNYLITICLTIHGQLQNVAELYTCRCQHIIGSFMEWHSCVRDVDMLAILGVLVFLRSHNSQSVTNLCRKLTNRTISRTPKHNHTKEYSSVLLELVYPVTQLKSAMFRSSIFLNF